MRRSAKAEYGCLALIALARRHSLVGPVRVKEIAETFRLPERFLVQILLQLKAAGLVQSVRGSSGGYRLARDPRQISLGEGGYATTEAHIRQLLLDEHPGETLPAPTDTQDTTPLAGSTTQETYVSLGTEKNYGGTGSYDAGIHNFTFPKTLAADSFALDGPWKLTFNGITTSTDGRIRLKYHASEVRIVVGGKGTVKYRIDGKSYTQRVGGFPNSYPLAKTATIQKGTVDVTVSPGVTVYSFTFG